VAASNTSQRGTRGGTSLIVGDTFFLLRIGLSHWLAIGRVGCIDPNILPALMLMLFISVVFAAWIVSALGPGRLAEDRWRKRRGEAGDIAFSKSARRRDWAEADRSN